MGRVKAHIYRSQRAELDGVFYKCEYLKEYDKVTPQCGHGGNSYCGEYKKRTRRRIRKLNPALRNLMVNLGYG